VTVVRTVTGSSSIDKEKNYIDKNNIEKFIDIGSNIGIYSLIIGKSFKKIKILSFEPVHNTFDNLNYNVHLNRLTRNIRIFNFGLSNRSGSKKMIALKKKNYIQSGGYSFYIPKRKIHKKRGKSCISYKYSWN
jgi:FkbM family methyltransferase